METKRKLRSQDWFGRKDKLGFIHRSWMGAQGFETSVFENKPVIGICNSWSELTNCNAHLRLVAEAVKRGVWAAGGFPLEFPTMSLGEPFMRPSTMMFRNLMAMDVEESIRANPLDGVVLLCGCDKTTPAQLMGAASADIPSIVVTGGPMLRGMWRNKEIGSGTDVWHYWDELRAGRITEEDWCEMESCMSRSAGHCMVMGTASTMTSIAEALGMTLPGCASIPAVDSRRQEIAQRSGGRIVEMVLEDLKAFAGDHAGSHRQCHPSRHGDRRLDQCHHSLGGDRRAAGDQVAIDGVRRDFPNNADDREHTSLGQILDGGYVLCRRRSGCDESN